ncbi:MAG: UDP-N-acetylmuramate dehydrogenase [Eubacteriales bacterium]|nr:UDP-N-acetylmuramate dehydrogenase [Eubacteriales bacterium]
MNLADTLRAATSIAQVLEHEPMARHTTMRVGGPAEILFSPAGEGELLFAVREAKRAGAPFRIIGNGSNLLVLDGGLPGLTIRLGEAFSKISVDGNQIRAQAGALLSRVAAAARDASLTGLEFASGIPGSAGGGMAMNAGAYGGQLSDVFEGCRALDPETGIISALGPAEMALGYRESAALSRGLIVTEAAFRLTAGDRSAIQAKMDDLSARRREKQPLNLPSAGSTFKRPEGHFAGALIEQAGLKGLRVGGACVSEKHAGFVVNDRNATARDVLDLIRLVQARVLEHSGVRLETEVRILGEE